MTSDVISLLPQSCRHHGAGVSEEVLALADGCALVPMLGFVDSYNVSVAAALTLYEVCAGSIVKLYP